MSEREWLKGCQRSWAALQSAVDMREIFNSLLQTVYDQL
jgi:hypothetical protein